MDLKDLKKKKIILRRKKRKRIYYSIILNLYQSIVLLQDVIICTENENKFEGNNFSKTNNFLHGLNKVMIKKKKLIISEEIVKN